MFRSVSTSCSNTKLSKLYRLKEEEQKNREKLENKYNQLDESVKQWDKMYFNPFNALLEKHGVKIISDVKTASDNDIKTYIEMTKLFIQGLITSFRYKANVNDQLLDSLRIINGEPMVKAGPATKHQKRWHGLPSMFGAASSPASGSKEATLTPPIVKKEDNDGWQTNKKTSVSCGHCVIFFIIVIHNIST